MMAVLHLNRCKNCRLWRAIDTRLPGQYQPGTPSRVNKKCHLQLRETTRKGERVLVPTMDVADDTTPGPKYGQHTKPGDTCKYFTQKHMPRRSPPPLVEQLDDVAAVDPANPRPVAGNEAIPIDPVYDATVTGRVPSHAPDVQNIPVRTEEGRAILGHLKDSDEGIGPS